MANPQKEHGHIRIANTVWDAKCKIRISGEAQQILEAVIRQTWGYGIKEAAITLDQFATKTGLNKPGIIRAVKKLVQMNLIIKKDNGTYSFQKDYDRWRPLPTVKRGLHTGLSTGLFTAQTSATIIKIDNLPTTGHPEKPDIGPEPIIKIDNLPLSKKIIPYISKYNINKQKTILSQVEALLCSLKPEIKEMINELIDIIRESNKTKKMSDTRKARELMALYQIYQQAKDKAVFEQALLITCNKQIPNINYLKAIVKRQETKPHETFMPPDCKNWPEYKKWKGL